MVSVMDFGAVGNGAADETKAFSDAFNSDEKEVYIPKGEYLIFDTLYVPSDKTIIADKDAFIKCADGCFMKETSFLLCNSDTKNGNSNITIKGGIWDGNNLNNMCKTYCTGTQTGVMLSFINVDGLTISDVVLQNSERFHIRLNKITNFLIENVYFNDTNLRPCSDGINIGGLCEFGKIRNIKARRGAPNDDLIAMNADDVMWYCMSRGRTEGYIRNIEIENVYGEDVYTAIRILSIKSEISNISIKNVCCGVREYGINLDAARYCMDPVFSDEDYPEGVGNISNIYMENITLFKTVKSDRPICIFETNADNFVIKNFKFIDNQFHELGKPSFTFSHMRKTEIEINGVTKKLAVNERYEFLENQIECLNLRRPVN